MKNKNIIGILLVGLGIAIGWLAKPSSSSPAPPVAATQRVSNAVTPARPTSLDESPILTKRMQREPTEKGNTGEQFKMSQDLAPEMVAMMSKKEIRDKNAKIEQRIAQLSEKLHLTPAQKSRLTAWLGGQIKKMEAMDTSNLASFESLSATARSLTNEALQNELTSDLTSEQQAALTDLNEKDFTRKVDTMALKTLSKIQEDIDFEDGQRDEVYKILTQNAENKERDRLNNTDNLNTSEESELVSDPYDLQLQDMAAGSVKKLSDFGDAGGFKLEIDDALIAKIDKRVNEKVDQLRPILNEKQLAIYRNKLDANKFQSVISASNSNPLLKIIHGN